MRCVDTDKSSLATGSCLVSVAISSEASLSYSDDASEDKNSNFRKLLVNVSTTQ